MRKNNYKYGKCLDRIKWLPYRRQIKAKKVRGFLDSMLAIAVIPSIAFVGYCLKKETK